EHALGDAAALLLADAPGGQRGHLAYRLLEREDALVANVVAEHAREGTVAARVRVAVAEAAERAVGRDHGPRVAHDAAHVVLVHDVPHAARAALELDLDRELRGEVEVGLAGALTCDVRERLALPRAVEGDGGELDAGEVAAA